MNSTAPRISWASGPSADPIPCAFYDAITAHPEQEAGDASEWKMWAGRVGRRVAIVDENGVRFVFTFENVADAAAFIARVEDEHARDIAGGEAMSTTASVGVVYGAWYDPPGYYYGDAMAGPLCQDCHRAAGYDVNDPDAHPIPCDGETDTPTHCEQCETLIAENLTREGEEYVRDALTDPAPWSRPEVLAAWREAYGYVLEGGQA